MGYEKLDAIDLSRKGSIKPSYVVFRDVLAHDTFVAAQFPVMIRTMGDPFGNAGLPVYLAGSHRDARLIAIGNDLLQAELTAVAEDSNKSNKHRHLPRPRLSRQISSRFVVRTACKKRKSIEIGIRLYEGSHAYFERVASLYDGMPALFLAT
jgi:hypothetical protein